MRTPAYHKSLETLHVNCLEPRAYFIPFADEKTAATRERGQSDYFLSLCGEWDFRFFKSFEDVLREPPEYVGEGGFDKIAVPRSWQTYVDRGYDVPLYSNLEYPFPTDPPFVPDENPCGLYVRKFTLDEKLASRDLFLNFEGVDSCFYVWLNGKFVGFSEVSHCTSEFDVTAFAESGENTLCVLVVKWCPGTYLEDQDCFRFSGIFREVYLLARGRERFDDIFVRSCVSDDLASAELSVETKLSTPCNVRYKLVAPDGAVVSKGVGGENLSIIISSPVLWNDEEPRLYELWLSVGDEVVLLLSLIHI